jgi:hypothetical protein
VRQTNVQGEGAVLTVIGQEDRPAWYLCPVRQDLNGEPWRGKFQHAVRPDHMRPANGSAVVARLSAQLHFGQEVKAEHARALPERALRIQGPLPSLAEIEGLADSTGFEPATFR